LKHNHIEKRIIDKLISSSPGNHMEGIRIIENVFMFMRKNNIFINSMPKVAIFMNYTNYSYIYKALYI